MLGSGTVATNTSPSRTAQALPRKMVFAQSLKPSYLNSHE